MSEEVAAMSEEAVATGDRLAEARVVVPRHVVHREFPTETVILNLKTGKYHGLNPTAGAMLEALSGSGSLEVASGEVAARFGLEDEEVAADMQRLCEALLERGLIELDEA
ncbi:MAG: PqqD family protein [Solirubrobacterales bacterium]